MARSNSPEGLAKHGYTLLAVKEWRERQLQANKPSGFDDFLRALGICVQCGGHGRLVTGIRWRDPDGAERKEAGPSAVLLERYNLENPAKWLSHTLKWDYLYEPCQACGTTGKT